MFYHAKLDLLLMVYVDDFKMAGPKANVPVGWELMRRGLRMEDPAPMGLCLGCLHHESTDTLSGVPVRRVSYDMETFLDIAVKSYESLAAKAGWTQGLKPNVQTPYFDTKEDPDDPGEPGALAGCAASILMKVMYAARLCRFDLLKPIASLASCITRWTRGCDRLLHRMMSYVKCSSKLRLSGYVGDKPEDLELQVFADADFAAV